MSGQMASRYEHLFVYKVNTVKHISHEIYADNVGSTSRRFQSS